MLNTRWALIMPGAISAWLLIVTRTYLQANIPDELVEAAQIDGANDVTILSLRATAGWHPGTLPKPYRDAMVGNPLPTDGGALSSRPNRRSIPTDRSAHTAWSA